MEHWRTRLTVRAVRDALADPAAPPFAPSGRMDRRTAEGAAAPRIPGPAAGVSPIHAAVLMPLYSSAAGLTVIFTRRADHLDKHAGQISFPGGRVEPGDASFLAAGQRETAEELGAATEGWEVWAELSPVYIALSNFLIHGFVVHAPSRPELQPSEGEIAELIEVPLHELFDPALFGHLPRTLEGRVLLEPSFHHRTHQIWGATANLVDQVVSRLEAALAPRR